MYICDVYIIYYYIYLRKPLLKWKYDFIKPSVTQLILSESESCGFFLSQLFKVHETSIRHYLLFIFFIDFLFYDISDWVDCSLSSQTYHHW